MSAYTYGGLVLGVAVIRVLSRLHHTLPTSHRCSVRLSKYEISPVLIVGFVRLVVDSCSHFPATYITPNNRGDTEMTQVDESSRSRETRYLESAIRAWSFSFFSQSISNCVLLLILTAVSLYHTALWCIVTSSALLLENTYIH